MVLLFFCFLWRLHLFYNQVSQLFYTQAMKIAYNEIWVYNLSVFKETKRWFKHEFISAEQSENIKAAYPTSLFNPNVMIRILLFVASILGLAGVTGILTLMVIDGSK